MCTVLNGNYTMLYHLAAIYYLFEDGFNDVFLGIFHSSSVAREAVRHSQDTGQRDGDVQDLPGNKTFIPLLHQIEYTMYMCFYKFLVSIVNW